MQLNIKTRTPGLYAIDFANGKRYVGISCRDARKRVQRHLRAAARGVAGTLNDAIRKHPPVRAFLLVQCEDRVALALMEKRAIRVFSTLRTGHGYNTLLGGYTPCPVNRRAADEAARRRKISAAMTGRPKSLAHRQNISAARIGMVFSQETCRRLSQSHQRSEQKHV